MTSNFFSFSLLRVKTAVFSFHYKKLSSLANATFSYLFSLTPLLVQLVEMWKMSLCAWNTNTKSQAILRQLVNDSVQTPFLIESRKSEDTPLNGLCFLKLMSVFLNHFHGPEENLTQSVICSLKTTTCKFSISSISSVVF